MSEESLLEEKDKAIKNWETMYKSVMQTCHNDKEEIERLNKQLADLQQEQIKEMQEHQEAMKLADKTINNLIEDNRASQEWYKKQLAESEKKFIIANNLRKKSDEVLLNYKTEKYGLEKTIQELRKMKLNLPEKEWYYKGFENCERQMSSHIADLTLEVKELKQQLAEKEKELKAKEKLNQIFKDNREVKISFAVEQLEKVKELVDLEYGHINIIDTIDNQIKQLKEGK